MRINGVQFSENMCIDVVCERLNTVSTYQGIRGKVRSFFSNHLLGGDRSEPPWMSEPSATTTETGRWQIISGLLARASGSARYAGSKATWPESASSRVARWVRERPKKETGTSWVAGVKKGHRESRLRRGSGDRSLSQQSKCEGISVAGHVRHLRRPGRRRAGSHHVDLGRGRAGRGAGGQRVQHRSSTASAASGSNSAPASNPTAPTTTTNISSTGMAKRDLSLHESKKQRRPEQKPVVKRDAEMNDLTS